MSLWFLLVPIIMFSSYMHGRGDGSDLVKQWYESKIVYIILVALFGMGLGAYTLGIWGLLCGLVSPLYWFTFRTGRQAKAELDYMYEVDGSSLLNILLQYMFPVGLCSIPMLFAGQWVLLAVSLISIVIVIATSFLCRKYINNYRHSRSCVELSNGLCGGINIVSALLAIITVVS